MELTFTGKARKTTKSCVVTIPHAYIKNKLVEPYKLYSFTISEVEE